MWTNRLLNQIDRLLEQPPIPPPEVPPAEFPLVDLWEDEEALHVEAEVAGLRRENFEVYVRGMELTLAGERTRVRPEHARVWTEERGEGKFRRIIQLPVEINTNNIEARYENGILQLRLEKAAPLRVRRIKVRGESEPSPEKEEPQQGTERTE